jgi:hypothetical protein
MADDNISCDGNIVFFEQPDTSEFDAKLVRLAERLGVPQATGGKFEYLLMTKGGEQFSVMDILHAFLDRIENATGDARTGEEAPGATCGPE